MSTGERCHCFYCQSREQMLAEVAINGEASATLTALGDDDDE